MTSLEAVRGSDFVGRLLERSSEQAPHFEPRLPSLFEAPTWSAAPTEEAPSERENERGAPVRTATPETHATAPSVLRESGPKATETAWPQLSAPRTEWLEPHAPRELEVRHLHELVQRDGPPGSHGAEVGPSRVLARRSIEAAEPAAPLSARALEPALAPRASLQGPRPAAPPESNLAPLLREAPSERVLPAPVQAMRAVVARLASSRESDAPSPVVQVSIGRLEVRATEPARRTERNAGPRGAVQPQSLSEYLAQSGRPR